MDSHAWKALELTWHSAVCVETLDTELLVSSWSWGRCGAKRERALSVSLRKSNKVTSYCCLVKFQNLKNCFLKKKRKKERKENKKTKDIAKTETGKKFPSLEAYMPEREAVKETYDIMTRENRHQFKCRKNFTCLPVSRVESCKAAVYQAERTGGVAHAGDSKRRF